MDRLELVRVFIRVAETGQVSEAARALSLSQPTASRQLGLLEGLLGTRLVDRLPQGVTLTEAGRAFLGPARALLESWTDATDAVRSTQSSVAGTIRVAVPSAVGQSFLADIAALFLRVHPDVAIEWHMRDDQVDVVAEGVDVWLHVGEIRRDDLVARVVYRIERALVTSPRNAVATHPRELLPAPAARLSPYVPATVPLRSDDGETFELRQRVVFETDSLFAVRAAVLGGVGYAVLPLWCVHEELARGSIVRTCASWAPPQTTLSLAYLPGRSRSARVSLFIGHLKSQLHGREGRGVAFLRQVNQTGQVVSADIGGDA